MVRNLEGSIGRRSCLLSCVVLLLMTGCTSELPTDPIEGVAQPAQSSSATTAPAPATSTNGNATADDREDGRQSAVVTRVIDGDTIEVRIEGNTVDLRLIGIDTPETLHPTESVECYGKAASRFTRVLLEGRDVQLEFDVERLDRYGRTLAYVWVGNTMANLTLVREGYAQVSTFPPNVRYDDEFIEAQGDARRRELGLWGHCRNEPEIDLGGAGGGDSGGGACDPSYPDVCIAPYPPDLDCDDVDATYFRVIEPDPHDFDSDDETPDDKIGCET
jgi:micrococcal nuclease